MSNKNRRFFLLIFILLLFSVLIQLPLYNRGLAYFDEGVIYNYAENILRSQVFFRDIFSYMAPGMFYTLALLYKIFGVSVIVSRIAVAVAFSSTLILVFLISRHLMEEAAAFLTALVFMGYRVWAFPIWNYPGYANFSIFFLAMAILALMRFIETPRLFAAFLAGFFVAIAALFKQDYGVSAGSAILIVIVALPYLRSRKEPEPVETFSRSRALAAYIAGGLIICLPVLIYFALEGALDDMVRQTLLIPLSVEMKRETTPLIPILPLLRQDAFVRENWCSYAPLTSLIRLWLGARNHVPAGFLLTKTPVWDIFLKTIHYSPYLTFLLVMAIIARCFQKGDFSLQYKKAAAVLIISVLLFLTQRKPFDFSHLMQMYLPVFLLAGFLGNILYRRLLLRKRLLYPFLGILGILLGIYLYYTIASVPLITQFYSVKLDGPRANIYLNYEDQYACSRALEFIHEHTRPDEPIYVLPTHGIFYFLAQRRNPTRFENLWPAKMEKNMDREIIETLEREKVEYVVEFPDLFFGPYKYYAPEIADYLHKAYTPVKRFGDPRMGMQITIMKRNEKT